MKQEVKKIGKHKIIKPPRFDQDDDGQSIVHFECEDDVVMEVTLPADCIKILSSKEAEYIHVGGEGVFTAHIHYSTHQFIAEHCREKRS